MIADILMSFFHSIPVRSAREKPIFFCTGSEVFGAISGNGIFFGEKGSEAEGMMCGRGGVGKTMGQKSQVKLFGFDPSL